MKMKPLAAAALAVLLLAGCGGAPTGPEPNPTQVYDRTPVDIPAEPEPAEAPAGTEPEEASGAPEQAEYRIERIRAAAENGRPVREVDLNGDGEVEGIIGALGEWHADEVIIVDSGGNHLVTLNDSLPPGILGRVDLVSVPGVSDSVLVRQAGTPEDWNGIEFLWMDGDQFVSPWGWHPKTNLAFGQDYAIEPDGTVAITGSLAGHTFVRRYQIERAAGDSFWPYQAVLTGEQVTPGPYPTTAGDLLTALFIARWYDLHDQIELYMPDPALREVFMAQDFRRVLYEPLPVRTGRLVDGEYGPQIEPAEPDEDGIVEFMAAVGEYEGGTYWTGRAAIGTAADGRLVVTSLEILDQGWAY